MQSSGSIFFIALNLCRFIEEILDISKNERKDGTATSWVLFKFFPVVPMLAQSPNDHLVCSSQSKKACRQALGHNTEGNPGPDFIGVIGA